MRMTDCLLFLLLPGFTFCQQRSGQEGTAAENMLRGYVSSNTKLQPLKGYPAFFYRAATHHPRVKSRMEKHALRHFLLGNGLVYHLTTDEFELLVQVTAKMYINHDSCVKDIMQQIIYCKHQINLYSHPYFDYCLGVTTIYFNAVTQQPFALYDYYDFNRKQVRRRGLFAELNTRLAQLFKPKKAKSFPVCFSCEFVLAK